MRPLLVSILAAVVTASARPQPPEPPGDPDDPAGPGMLAPVAEGNGKLLPALDTGYHVGGIVALCFTPDGKSVVSVGFDRSVQVWDVLTGDRTRIWRLPGHRIATAARPAGAVLAPDGKTLLVGFQGTLPAGEPPFDSAVLLHLDDGRLLPLPKAPAQVTQVSLSADGNRALAANGAGGTVWTGLTAAWDKGAAALTATGLTTKDADARLVTLSPDGTRVAVMYAESRTFELRDVGEKGDALVPAGPGGAVLSLGWGRDGKELFTVHGPAEKKDGRTVRVWSADGKLQKTFPFADPEKGGVFTPTGRVEPAGADHVLCFSQRGGRRPFVLSVNRTTGTVATVLDRLDMFLHFSYSAAAVSPDGKRAAVAHGPGGSRVVLFDVKPNATPRYLDGARYAITDVAWSHDGKGVMWTGRGMSRPNTGLDLTTFTPHDRLSKVEMTEQVHKRDGWTVHKKGGDVPPGGLKFTPGKKTPPPLMINKGKKAGSLKVETTGAVRAFTLPAAGEKKWVAVATDTGFYLHDTTTGKAVHQFLLPDVVNALAPSPDGKYLLAATFNQTMYVFRPDRAAPILAAYVTGRDWVVWTPREGYYAATPGGEQMMGWTVSNGPTRAATYYPAEQFRKQLYRPDVIKLVLETGGVEEAVTAANAARVAAGEEVPAGETAAEKLLPPGVTLTVADRTALPKVTVAVAARQSCPEQPIKSLRLLVDGRPLPEGAAAVTFPPGREKAQFETRWTLDLPPGKHTLAVLARSKDDTPSASNAVEVTSPTAAKDRPGVFHVAVGVNAYDRPELALKAARGDAERLAEGVAVAAKTGTAYQPRPGAVLLDQAATRAAVLNAIQTVRQARPRPGDLFVLSFAGHGVRSGGEFYLLTKEADPTSAATLARTALSGRELAEKLADFPCQVLLLLDACHAGAVGAFRPGADEAARALSDADVRVAVMCAALGHEAAIEKDGVGLFTAAVVRALRRDPDAFYDRETGELNVYHLQAFVYQEVSKASDARQTPYLKMPLAQPAFTLARFR